MTIGKKNSFSDKANLPTSAKMNKIDNEKIKKLSGVPV